MNKQELQSLLEGVRTALTGNQSKLDKNQNNKIDREDFALLRSKKKPMAENADLHGLLEQLYAVLLDEKAARLQEAPYGGSSGAQYNASRGQSANPQNFRAANQRDNDEIRASIYREDEKRKREEKERRRTAQMDQMENAQYDSIFENIYNLLVEEPPNDGTGPEGFGGPPVDIQPLPWQEPVYPYYGPGPTPPSGYDPGYGSGGYHPDNPLLRDRNFRPEVPPLPDQRRPPFPPCPQRGSCGFRWVDNATPGVWWWSGSRWILQGRIEQGHWEWSPHAVDPHLFGNPVLRFLWPYGYEDPATRRN